VSDKGLEGGGENSHKIQCKRLIVIRERYMEMTKKEIVEKVAILGMQDGGVAGTSSASYQS
jgi:hypothetical protein